MSKFVNILQRAARKKTDKISTVDTQMDHEPQQPQEPRKWLSQKLEIIVSLCAAGMILFFCLITLLVAKGHLDWRIGSGSHSSKTEEIAEYTSVEDDVVIEEVAQEDELPEDISGDYTLNGNMKQVGDIRLELSISFGSVTGHYGYRKSGYNPIALTGSVEDNGRMTLFEMDEYGDYHGCFIGKFNGSTYSGEFTNYASGKSYPFETHVSYN